MKKNRSRLNRTGWFRGKPVRLNRFSLKPPFSLRLSSSSLAPNSSCPVPFPEHPEPLDPASPSPSRPLLSLYLVISFSLPYPFPKPAHRSPQTPIPKTTLTHGFEFVLFNPIPPPGHVYPLRWLHRHRPHQPPAHHKSTVKVEGLRV